MVLAENRLHEQSLRDQLTTSTVVSRRVSSASDRTMRKLVGLEDDPSGQLRVSDHPLRANDSLRPLSISTPQPEQRRNEKVRKPLIRVSTIPAMLVLPGEVQAA